MWEIIIFLLLIFIAAVTILISIFNIIRLAIQKIKHTSTLKSFSHLKRSAIFLAINILICIIFIAFTQIIAYTPAINDAGENSIAELRKVNLNGHTEWISIRGEDTSKPVLLFLAGGPGGSQMAAERHNMPDLEKYFTVVNWDQPGSGKSYNAISHDELTPENYIEDGYALTKYLCNEFKQDKIYLVGESWGSALGIFLASKYPEYYHAFIGTGQMVSFLETEKIDYDYALKSAQENGDTDVVEKLKKDGAPPYYGSNAVWKSNDYYDYLNHIMNTNPDISNRGFNTMRDLSSPEYGILDKINFMLGMVNTFNTVYPQLYNTDLRNEYNNIKIPVYFFLGKHDVNAPLSLSEDYYQKLNAPSKKIIYFEHSGHCPWINESDKFVQTLKDISDNNL